MTDAHELIHALRVKVRRSRELWDEAGQRHDAKQQCTKGPGCQTCQAIAAGIAETHGLMALLAKAERGESLD